MVIDILLLIFHMMMMIMSNKAITVQIEIAQKGELCSLNYPSWLPLSRLHIVVPYAVPKYKPSVNYINQFYELKTKNNLNHNCFISHSSISLYLDHQSSWPSAKHTYGCLRQLANMFGKQTSELSPELIAIW